MERNGQASNGRGVEADGEIETSSLGSRFVGSQPLGGIPKGHEIAPSERSTPPACPHRQDCACTSTSTSTSTNTNTTAGQVSGKKKRSLSLRACPDTSVAVRAGM